MTPKPGKTHYSDKRKAYGKRKGQTADIPDTIKSVIETYRVAGAMTDPYGSYTGNNDFGEVAAEDSMIAEDIIPRPVQDADDL